jgi:hypothetical protein
LNHYQKLFAGVIFTLAAAGANAQSSIFNQILNTAAQQINRTQPTQGAASDAASYVSAATAPPWLGDAAPMFPTKESFLAAARRGELTGIARTSDTTAEGKAITASIATILANEYNTPIPGDRANDTCRSVLSGMVHNWLADTTQRYTDSLTQQPPSFYQDVNVRPLYEAKSISNYCFARVLGQERPYPFIESLSRFMDEYGQATKAYVEQARAERVRDYQTAESAKQDAAARQDAERRDAEQRRIAAQRQRIEEQQRLQKQRAASRVAG